MKLIFLLWNNLIYKDDVYKNGDINFLQGFLRSVFSNIIMFMFNIIKLTKKKHHKYELNKDSEAPIISLTTFPFRMKYLWLTIESILSQTYKPYKIVLTLTEEEFPEKNKTFPESIKKYVRNNIIEIIYLKENLKPHNKYYGAFNKYKNNTIITIDDDLYYHHDMIKNLVNLHNQYPNCICCNRGRLISENVYFKWSMKVPSCKPSDNIIALGYGGVLYPKEFRPEGLFIIDDIMKKSLNADDLWLKIHEYLNGFKIVVSDYQYLPIKTFNTIQKVALNKTNISDSNNDEIWNDLLKSYKELIKVDEIFNK